MGSLINQELDPFGMGSQINQAPDPFGMGSFDSMDPFGAMQQQPNGNMQNITHPQEQDWSKFDYTPERRNFTNIQKKPGYCKCCTLPFILNHTVFTMHLHIILYIYITIQFCFFNINMFVMIFN